mmetsp:Transcript_40314/g.89533  ORF Transcript_40314/g.89533 Transcript_40314/m.89533 type:complete len:200 (+) Transcript_40314:709-1308(+)
MAYGMSSLPKSLALGYSRSRRLSASLLKTYMPQLPMKPLDPLFCRKSSTSEPMMAPCRFLSPSGERATKLLMSSQSILMAAFLSPLGFSIKSVTRPSASTLSTPNCSALASLIGRHTMVRSDRFWRCRETRLAKFMRYSWSLGSTRMSSKVRSLVPSMAAHWRTESAAPSAHRCSEGDCVAATTSKKPEPSPLTLMPAV